MADANEDVDSVASLNADGFAFYPGRASNEVINYNTKEGKATWKAATEALDPNDKFDCNPEGLRNFLKNVQLRGLEYGWDTVLEVPIDSTDILGESLDFIENYGSFSMEHLREVAEQYVNTQTRAAQDSAQLYFCLMKSLSATGRNKVNLHETEYLVGPQYSGIMCLKVIIRISAIDTNATEMTIRQQLSNLDTYIATISYDITKLNQHVNTLMEQLTARGGTTNDLLANLFRAYKSVKDRTFVQYIVLKESDYEEGSSQLTYTKLMLLADNKYKILKEKGEWCAPSAEEEKIIALQADLKKLRSQQKGGKKGKGKEGKDEKQGGKGKKGNDKSKKGKKDNAWMYEAPKEGEPHEKTKNGKKWIFCKHHKRWGEHTSEECKKIGLDNNKSDRAGDKGNNKGTNPRLVQAKAATVRFKTDDDSSDDDE